MSDFNPDRFLECLEEAGVDSPRRRSGRSWIFVCPACGSKALKMYRTSGFFTCFSCRFLNGMHGPAEVFLARLLNVPTAQARARLYGVEGTPLRTRIAPVEWSTSDEEDGEVIPTVTWRWGDRPLDHPHAARGVAYLATRGITKELAEQYGVRYNPEDRRVLFPISHDGRLVGWQGRLVVPHEWRDADGKKQCGIKVLTEGLPTGVRDRVLMFQDRLVPGGHCVLGEGPVGAIKAHLCGGNVATMGKVVSEAQLQLLVREGVTKLYLALDPDAADETMRIARKTASHLQNFMLEIPPDKEDTGEMTPEHVYDVFRSARPLKPWTIVSWWGKKRCTRAA